MDSSAFAHITRAVTALRSRRAIAAGLAAFPLLGSALLLPDDAAAKRKRRPQRTAQAEKKKKKKPYCVNGQTTQVSITKKSKKRLKKQGATPGACAAATCPTCPSGQRCCGASCVIGPWANQTTFGSGGSGPSNFAGPYDIALTPDTRTAWIADPGNNRISVWSRSGPGSTDWANQTSFGTTGSGPSGLRSPWGLAVAPDGLTVWIADVNNNRISVWARASPTDVWTNQSVFGDGQGSGIRQFQFPSDVAVTEDGRTAVVADDDNDRVSVWTRPTATPIAIWTNQQVFGVSGSGPNGISGAAGVAVSADGLLVAVADRFNNRISIWSRGSATAQFLPQTTFGSGPGAGPTQLDEPRRVAFSADTLTAYVGDYDNNRVSIWSRSSASSIVWSNLTTLGTRGNSAAELSAPRGVAPSPDGQTLWVTDYGNNRISVWAMACPA